MKTENGITVVFVRSNELQDVYKVTGNGFDEYVYRNRDSGDNEESVLNDFIN